MQIISLVAVDSTMSVMDQILKSSSLAEGSVVTAAFQHLGRGMEDNPWESEPERNLLATFVLYPKFLYPARQFLLNCCASLAVYDIVVQQLPDERVSVKWPNDIYIGKQKVAGLLIRHEIRGESLEQSLIGVGLNVNQQTFRSSAPNPVSFIQKDGLLRDVSVILKNLQTRLMYYYEALKKGEGEYVFERYHSCLYQLNVPALYLIRNQSTMATISGVDSFGLLRLMTSSGEEVRCDHKEIVFL